MSEPADPTAPAPGAPPLTPPSDEEAWSSVLGAWGDEAVHRAYLGRFTDLDGLAVAGGRYRAFLAERPQDPMALRMREELLRKATLLGLQSLPRSGAPRRVRRAIIAVGLLGGIAALAFVLAALYRFLGGAS